MNDHTDTCEQQCGLDDTNDCSTDQNYGENNIVIGNLSMACRLGTNASLLSVYSIALAIVLGTCLLIVLIWWFAFRGKTWWKCCCKKEKAGIDYNDMFDGLAGYGE
jgi:hypothetical protein